jgi:predicted transcriptional regulator of viral defense system
VDRAVGYALKLDAAVAKRLGWILERRGVVPARLAALRKMPVKGTRLLDPTGPRRGPVDAGWMIQVNAPGVERR